MSARHYTCATVTGKERFLVVVGVAETVNSSGSSLENPGHEISYNHKKSASM